MSDVAWLFAPDGLSEHPGDFKHTGKPLVGPGMQWTADRVHAAATGPLWAKTAIVITWDDWGGWYDHVAPLLASTWPGGGHAGYQNSQCKGSLFAAIRLIRRSQACLKRTCPRPR